METFIIIVGLLWVSPEKSGELSAFELTHLEGKSLKFNRMQQCLDHVSHNYVKIVLSMRDVHENMAVPFQIFCKGDGGVVKL
jgi:hypothetical protein|tara:strand:- start:9979 stop:10224 length:246 start_codon:yes stop_codon:yes gene_type:complete